MQIINTEHLFLMMLKMTEINYDNFKNSVNEIERKNAYSNVWMELQK